MPWTNKQKNSSTYSTKSKVLYPTYLLFQNGNRIKFQNGNLLLTEISTVPEYSLKQKA